MSISNWGRYPKIDGKIITPQTPSDTKLALTRGFRGIARGMGRSYGDSSLAGQMISTLRLNFILEFDETNGFLRCAAGVTLAELLEVFVPRGWFLPVTPGTKFVTVGGAIASDVHGKNHHVEGSFCDHLNSITLLLADGTTLRCSPLENPVLFHATCGGMGLTGIILDAAFSLKPITSVYINETIFKATDITETIELFAVHAATTYSVAWIDCLSGGAKLGRSLLMMGEHAQDGCLDWSRPRSLPFPFDLPNSFLNRHLVAAFNEIYYRHIRGKRVERVVPYEPFFYPLDRILQWNRLYGSSGFTQYQLVIPQSAGWEAMRTILSDIARSQRGSFLAVLKVFGRGNDNHLSFPMEGYTLALDFKLSYDLFSYLDRLDRIVLDYGGRLYLSKDARMSAAMFKAGYPRWEEFMKTRCHYGAEGLFHSLQSERLGI
ncbi:decaprenylphospho-beta-D-ribofuranose 2-oxidase [Gammaproteobacteria bacterium]